MKKVETVLVEYVKKLSDEELSFLRMRVVQNLHGDRADIANFLSRDAEVDRWLRSAASAEEFFDALQSAGDCVMKESERRDAMAVAK